MELWLLCFGFTIVLGLIKNYLTFLRSKEMLDYVNFKLKDISDITTINRLFDILTQDEYSYGKLLISLRMKTKVKKFKTEVDETFQKFSR